MHIRVVSPSLSLSTIPSERVEAAIRTVEGYGHSISFSNESQQDITSTILPLPMRITEMHNAYTTSSVDFILAATGGMAANQLLPHLDYNIIQNNPKMLLGYSDTNVLQNAIFAKTTQSSLSSPSLSTIGKGDEQSLKWLFETLSSAQNRCPVALKSADWQILSKGKSEGKVIGGNLTSFQLLYGTPYMPSLEGSILFFELSALNGNETKWRFESMINALFMQKGADRIKGLVLGRFSVESQINVSFIVDLISRHSFLQSIPVINNVEFGHIFPMITYPIGSVAQLAADDVSSTITFDF